METSKMSREHSKRKTLGVILLATVMPILVILGVNLWLGSQQCVFCPNPDMIGIYSVTLGSNGWATFNMTGAWAFNHTMRSVTAYKEPYPSTRPASPPLGSVFPTSNNFLPAKGKLILSVQFQGISWQQSVNYTFVLTTFEGNVIGVQGCLNGC